MTVIVFVVDVLVLPFLRCLTLLNGREPGPALRPRGLDDEAAESYGPIVDDQKSEVKMQFDGGFKWYESKEFVTGEQEDTVSDEHTLPMAD